MMPLLDELYDFANRITSKEFIVDADDNTKFRKTLSLLTSVRNDFTNNYYLYEPQQEKLIGNIVVELYFATMEAFDVLIDDNIGKRNLTIKQLKILSNIAEERKAVMECL